jgi:hypothetical protein
MEKDIIIPSERIINKIYIIRNRKVMLDRDLAELYGVKTRALNQAVKRNIERFPEDFMFQLTKEEVKYARSQFVTLQKGGWGNYAFAEQGVAMLSSVLKSKRAIAVNIQIIRTFTKIRELLVTNESLQRKIMELEKKYTGHDEKIKKIFDILHLLLEDENKNKSKKEIGFKI